MSDSPPRAVTRCRNLRGIVDPLVSVSPTTDSLRPAATRAHRSTTDHKAVCRATGDVTKYLDKHVHGGRFA